MEEVRARKGELFVCSDQGCNIQPSEGMHVIQLPENYGVLSPILHVIPLQLLAYHTAIAKGTDVDKPRNLAKSVTTELSSRFEPKCKSRRCAGFLLDF